MRAGATSNYTRFNVNVERTVGLPDVQALKGWQLRARLNGQWADKPLVSSERFGVSGAQGVRGYYEDTLFADRGLIGNLELQTPSASLTLLGRQGLLQGYVFLDAGRAWNKSPQVVPDLGAEARTTYTLVSHGLGLRFNLGATLVMRADVGWPHIGLPGKQGALGHISVTAAF